MAGYSPVLVCALLASFLPATVVGHGSMVKPISWIDTGGHVGMASLRSCEAGTHLPVGAPGLGGACMWFSNFTFIPGNKTLDPSMTTFPQDISELNMDKNPWSAPGSAPIFSPCGVAGGNPNGCPEGSSQGIGEDCPGGGFSYGSLAEEFYMSPGFPDVITTEWKAGSVVEAAWGVIANHGGGYSYRICKVPEEGMGALTEECFQQNTLEFSGDMQWVQYGNDVSTRIEFEAHRTRKGTFPEGSQWTRDPIPNCFFTEDPGPNGSHGLWDVNCTHGTQFLPPAQGLFGYGEGPPPYYQPTFGFSIGDELVVPSDLSPGEYVLSFRWDCEQTSQVWNQCANIKIVQ